MKAIVVQAQRNGRAAAGGGGWLMMQVIAGSLGGFAAVSAILYTGVNAGSELEEEQGTHRGASADVVGWLWSVCLSVARHHREAATHAEPRVAVADQRVPQAQQRVSGCMGLSVSCLPRVPRALLC